MTPELKLYEKTIKKKHSFGWTPKYEEEIKTSLNKKVFVPIVVKTFEKLGWDLVHQDDFSAEAKRRGEWNRWTEKISVTYEHGKVKVKSISLGNEMWDVGRNSKRVKLFIHSFQEKVKEFDAEALEELEREVERINNWDDYEIPESLPQPKRRTKPKIYIAILGGLLLSLILGFLLAFLSFKAIYIIGLFEVGVAIAIGFVFKYLIKASNYTNFSVLNYIMIGVVILTYLSNQYFQYELILNEYNLERIGFIEFMKLRFREGLTIKSLDTGWIGLVISWAIQLGLTWLIAYLRIASSLTAYQLERIPTEVTDFAAYHFIKDKKEEQVRGELSKMGWVNKQDQDEVFESLGAVYSANELRRMD